MLKGKKMKKSIIALAVAGAMTVPAIASADATLYGTIEAWAITQDGSSIDIKESGGEVGVKGDVDFGMDSVHGIFQWETDIDVFGQGRDASFAANDGFFGIAGDFGTIKLGDLDLATDFSPGGSFDIDDPTSGSSFAQRGNISYTSPTTGGLTFDVVLLIDGSISKSDPILDDDENVLGIGDKETIDASSLGLKYAMGDFTGRVAYATHAENGHLASDANKTNFGMSYSAGAIDMGISYNIVDNSGVKDKGFEVGSKLSFGSGMSLAAAYSFGDMDNMEKQETVQVELRKDLNGRGALSVGTISKNAAETGSDDQTNAYLGYRISF